LKENVPNPNEKGVLGKVHEALYEKLRESKWGVSDPLDCPSNEGCKPEPMRGTPAL